MRGDNLGKLKNHKLWKKSELLEAAEKEMIQNTRTQPQEAQVLILLHIVNQLDELLGAEPTTEKVGLLGKMKNLVS